MLQARDFLESIKEKRDAKWVLQQEKQLSSSRSGGRPRLSEKVVRKQQTLYRERVKMVKLRYGRVGSVRARMSVVNVAKIVGRKYETCFQILRRYLRDGNQVLATRR